MNIEEKIRIACEKAYNYIRNNTPIDTGNLRFNSLKIMQESPDHYVIYIDENIAPYMVYTNEEWQSSKWNGKQNPNEEWWNKAVEMAIKIIQNELGGTAQKDDSTNDTSGNA